MFLPMKNFQRLLFILCPLHSLVGRKSVYRESGRLPYKSIKNSFINFHHY